MKTRLILCLLIVFGYQLNAQNTEVATVRLSVQEKGIILIASYTAQGKLVNLRDALNEGLNNGLTINEIKEVLVHLYAYAGFPRSIRGLQTFLEVLDDRKSKGIIDERGVEASPISETQDKYDRGKKILESLVGRSLDGPKPAYQEFSPEVDRFLKEHLFADIFERDVLSHKQRELVTISVIASLGTLEPMLKSHLNLSLNVGWQQEQLLQFTKVLEGTTTTENATAAKIVLKEVLDNRN
ncbi:carboxymuconolactone decarboxylase family protein [Maribacter stanieri]|uniref:carboxymuconolactone decarboxylase family protein n=1 Tax=Maribacter stanieri TaxID=440514 RepID=UPI0030D7D5B7|tara:strand:- start:931 stop:1650 length:720 start_codon:yes stop_codon:yes gene_type:complete